jgi:hypothetical protein
MAFALLKEQVVTRHMRQTDAMRAEESSRDWTSTL